MSCMADIGVPLSALLKKRLKLPEYRDPNCSVTNELSFLVLARIALHRQTMINALLNCMVYLAAVTGWEPSPTTKLYYLNLHSTLGTRRPLSYLCTCSSRRLCLKHESTWKVASRRLTSFSLSLSSSVLR